MLHQAIRATLPQWTHQKPTATTAITTTITTLMIKWLLSTSTTTTTTGLVKMLTRSITGRREMSMVYIWMMMIFSSGKLFLILLVRLFFISGQPNLFNRASGKSNYFTSYPKDIKSIDKESANEQRAWEDKHKYLFFLIKTYGLICLNSLKFNCPYDG